MNIGRKEQIKRRLLGVYMLVAAAVLFYWLGQHHFPKSWRAVLFVPLLIAFLGIFQAAGRVCVFLAVRNVQSLDQGSEKVEDADLARTLRRRALRITFFAFTASLLLTALAISLFP